MMFLLFRIFKSMTIQHNFVQMILLLVWIENAFVIALDPCEYRQDGTILMVVCPNGANLDQFDLNKLLPMESRDFETIRVLNANGLRGPLQSFPNNLCSFQNLKVILRIENTSIFLFIFFELLNEAFRFFV